MKVENPMVSVVIPIYNVENYLIECLDSVINQTFKKIEILCVDDCSADNSLSILKKYQKIDNRIKIFRHKNNLGLGPARNTGIENSNSPYIVFIDSDDYIKDDMIEKLFSALNSNKADLSWCSTTKVSEFGDIIYTDFIPDLILKPNDVFNNHGLFPSVQTVTNKMFKRDLIYDIKQLPILIEDEPTVAEYLFRCNKIVTLSHSLYYYRHTPGSLSNPLNQSKKYWDDYFNNYRIYFNVLKNNYLSKKLLKKQIALRCKAIFWRLHNFKSIYASNWIEQKKQIIKHLNNDTMYIKKHCNVIYLYFLLIFKLDSNKKLQSKLIFLGLQLSKNIWPKRPNFSFLIFDLHKVFFPFFKKNLLKFFFKTEIIFYKFLASFLKFSSSPIWLIGERQDTAEENGYFFYNYLKANKKNIRSFYIIDLKSKNLKMKKKLIDLVQYNSFRHKLLFFASKYYITSHNHYCFPKSRFANKRFLKPKNLKNIFLDHGITQADVSDIYGKNASNIDLFICAAKKEYNYVKNNFGYKEYEVAYTGFPRFDGLHNYKAKKQILIMPTWRKSLYSLKNLEKIDLEKEFKKTNYFNIFQSLFNNKTLQKLLNSYGYKLVFYPHYEIQHFLKFFHTDNVNIEIASIKKTSVQDLLKESSLLITDTSSVFFDFAYMCKPIIYYFFDQKKYFKEHLKKSYFDHEKMGFGELVFNENELLKEIKFHLNNNCKMLKKYSDRVKEFFPLHDNKNCERVFNEIDRLK